MCTSIIVPMNIFRDDMVATLDPSYLVVWDKRDCLLNEYIC